MENEVAAAPQKAKPWYLKGDTGTLIVLGAATVIAVLILVFVFVLPQGHGGGASLFAGDLNLTRQVTNGSVFYSTAFGQELGIVFNANGTKVVSAGQNNFNRNLTQINSYYTVNGITMDCLYTYPTGFPNKTSGKVCIKWPLQTMAMMRRELFPTSIADVFNPVGQANASMGPAYYNALLQNVSYVGIKNISGRLCDYFSYSNPGANPPVSINICLDRQYGIVDDYNSTILGSTEIRLAGFAVDTPQNVTIPKIGIYVSNVTCSSGGLKVRFIPLVNIADNTTIRTTFREGSSTASYITENVTTKINGTLAALHSYNFSVNPGHALNTSQESLMQIGGLAFCAGNYCGSGDMFESSCT